MYKYSFCYKFVTIDKVDISFLGVRESDYICFLQALAFSLYRLYRRYEGRRMLALREG